MEIEHIPTSTGVESFVPYLSNWFIDVSQPTVPRRSEKGYPIGTSCTGITTFIGYIFTYINSGYADTVYAELPAMLQRYKPYFVLSDINSVLRASRDLLFPAFNLRVAGESVIRQLYRFSQAYAVKLHIGQSPSCSIHHFSLYQNKILSTWGENFYIYYSESDTTEDEFVFYAMYNGTPEGRNMFQEITKKYIFSIDKFVLAGERVVENTRLPPIYSDLLNDIIAAFHHVDENMNEIEDDTETAGEGDEDKGQRILLKYITAAPDEDQLELIQDRMNEVEELVESDEINADSYIKRIIAAVLLSNEVSIEDINDCLYDYQEGTEAEKYNTYWISTKEKLYKAREDYFAAPTEENDFYKYYQSELDRITPNGNNHISVWCSLSANASDTSLSTEAKTYNQNAWGAMAPFVPNNRITLGTPMTIYGYYYNNILTNVTPANNEYIKLMSAGKTDETILAKLQESYAAMEINENDIVARVSVPSSCSCILERTETGKYKYVPKAPQPPRMATRSMNNAKSAPQEVPEKKSRKTFGGRGRTRKTKRRKHGKHRQTKKRSSRKNRSTRKHRRAHR
jgi:hypothetical protein